MQDQYFRYIAWQMEPNESKCLLRGKVGFQPRSHLRNSLEAYDIIASHHEHQASLQSSHPNSSYFDFFYSFSCFDSFQIPLLDLWHGTNLYIGSSERIVGTFVSFGDGRQCKTYTVPLLLLTYIPRILFTLWK
jgi:hypothetical protein